MFWDGRATGLTLGDPLAEQAMGPFLNPLEQNNASASLFLAVWGTHAFDDTVTAFQMIGRSIAEYERTAEVSPYNSRFDTSIGTGNGLTPQETLGLSLFNGKAKCASCHTSTVDPSSGKVRFTDFTYINLGVPKNPMNPFYSEFAFNPLGASWVDLGLGGYLKSAGFVKAYGHNGYFKSLEEIVHFYNTRDVSGAGWPAPEYAANMTSEVGNLGLTPAEEAAIVAFLNL